VESASIVAPRTARLRVCALGGSVGTPEEGITAEVVEVRSFDELRSLGGRAAGKIVFFNRPFDRTRVNPFEAYGGAVNQRGAGAVEAARAGGVAALVRSMTSRIDTVPHTGAMGYNDTVPKVPAAAVATADADMLSSLLRKENGVTVSLRLSAEQFPDVLSSNVVGELTGSEKPPEVIVIGAHLKKDRAQAPIRERAS
jgi:Zn-dependent M28 family amino/carboxypeptidase